MSGLARFQPLFCAAVLIVGVSVWLALRIPQGMLTYPDELLTAERSREMLLLGRDTVHFNFRPSFAKPPLQYWLTTLSLPVFRNSSTAVRIWPLAYGILTAMAVGWLAFLLSPKHPWLIPLSVAIYLSCPLFSTEATRALLDTGLGFYTTVAICFAQLARRKPIWWLGVAMACWLGALQKIPLIFLIWAIIVAVRMSSPTERPALRNRWLPISVLLAAALVALWPLFQHVNYGMPLMRAFAGDEPAKLFGQRHLGARPYFEVIEGLVASGWAGGGFAVLAALGFIFWQRERIAARELSFVAVIVTLLALICNFRSVRYVVPIVPSLCVVLAVWLQQFLDRDQKSFRRAVAFAALLVTGGFVQAFIKMHHSGGPEPAGEYRAAQALGALQSETTATLLVESGREKRDLRGNAFYLFHGDLKWPLTRRNLDELANFPTAQPIVGACAGRDFPELQKFFVDAEIVFATDKVVCWRTGARPSP
jgi:4-amino-4-deoxy-L-arabinose transferase-like glycosyltransferase